MESVLNELKQLMEQHSEGLATDNETANKILDTIIEFKDKDLIKFVAEALKSDELL